MRESILQRKIAGKLRENGYLVYKWVSPGRRGVPDLIAFGANGVAIAVEVKTPTGRVSKFQTRVIEQLRAVGAHAHVVRSVEEIEQIIENIK